MKVTGLLSALLVCLLTGSASADSACTNTDDDCDWYAERDYCITGGFSIFMQEHCRKSCGFCRPVSPAPVKCGLRPYDSKHSRGPREPRDRTKRIVEGQDAAYGEYPWQVLVRSVSGRLCGGVIINEYWVLSAAHCFDPIQPSHKYFIIVGDRDRRFPEQDQQRFDVEKVINHADYRPKPIVQNDIALVKIRPNNGAGIQYTDNVQPACLPTTSTPYTEGTECLISGWGSFVFEGHASKILQGAVVKIMSEDTCKQGDWYYDAGKMCAGLKQGGAGTCRGDSGGPLVAEVNGSYTLLGLTSHGYYCTANAEHPDYYARVAHFLPWIKDHMAKYSNGKERILPTPW